MPGPMFRHPIHSQQHNLPRCSQICYTVGNRWGGGFDAYATVDSQPTQDELFRQAYMRSLETAFNTNIGAPLGLNLGGGLYRSTNPTMAGKSVSGLTGAEVPQSTAIAEATVPQASSVTTTPVVEAANNLANVTKPAVPQFVQPYQNVTRGFGAYGERDIF